MRSNVPPDEMGSAATVFVCGLVRHAAVAPRPTWPLGGLAEPDHLFADVGGTPTGNRSSTLPWRLAIFLLAAGRGTQADANGDPQDRRLAPCTRATERHQGRIFVRLGMKKLRWHYWHRFAARCTALSSLIGFMWRQFEIASPGGPSPAIQGECAFSGPHRAVLEAGPLPLNHWVRAGWVPFSSRLRCAAIFRSLLCCRLTTGLNRSTGPMREKAWQGLGGAALCAIHAPRWRTRCLRIRSVRKQLQGVLSRRRRGEPDPGWDDGQTQI